LFAQGTYPTFDRYGAAVRCRSGSIGGLDAGCDIGVDTGC
jgi:hypothetical protein